MTSRTKNSLLLTSPAKFNNDREIGLIYAWTAEVYCIIANYKFLKTKLKSKILFKLPSSNSLFAVSLKQRRLCWTENHDKPNSLALWPSTTVSNAVEDWLEARAHRRLFPRHDRLRKHHTTTADRMLKSPVQEV